MNSPKAWRSWWDQLHKLSKAGDTSTTELKQFIGDSPPKCELSMVAAEDMTPTDVNESFRLTEVHGPEAWQFPRPLILFRPDFGTQNIPNYTYQANQGQPDSTVWGVLTDGQWFYFFRLNNGGQWSCVGYQVLRDGWPAIANIIAYMMVQGHETAASLLRSSTSPKVPRIPPLNIAAVLDEQMLSAAR
ncbi:hypothetical protein N7530_007991 [Penicillium desertorum]|uniref:Uncharacterized protein n=1 Tax=Penicillium desertorum TaxID=1303715 RepID=A0A9X0BKK2_9EURO|nr:hypothetical protein N7530_007991 [Penicillium desertorum]